MSGGFCLGGFCPRTLLSRYNLIARKVLGSTVRILNPFYKGVLDPHLLLGGGEAEQGLSKPPTIYHLK